MKELEREESAKKDKVKNEKRKRKMEVEEIFERTGLENM